MNYAEEIAKAALEIHAIKLQPDNPFTWASGYRMPIYNDNRMFLIYPRYRELILNALKELLQNEGISFDVIAGTSTSGIPPATTLADSLGKPLIYIRDKPKGHGLKNQIEGIDAESGLQGKEVILIEDLISTGGSSAKAVQAIRDANGICKYCISIFNYGLGKANNAFEKLDEHCEVRSLLTYDTLLDVAKQIRYISFSQAKMLAEWRQDPFNWGEKHGFPKVIKIELTEKEKAAREIVCLPLDGLATIEEVKARVKELSPVVGLFKIGKETFTRFGPEIVKIVQDNGANVFLDLKYHDIPNTVKGAADAASKLGVYMFNIHASGGLEMMQAAVEGAREGAMKYGTKIPKITAVTVLTSIDNDILNYQLNVPGALPDQVLKLAQLSQQAGLDGIVCSAADLQAIKNKLPENFMFVTPGIKGPNTPAGADQKRVFTPGNAVQDGSSILVIGRAITGHDTSEQRVKAAHEVLQDMAKLF
jgi:orotate phosphoribosyltransferase